jgi:hypothetical protein
MHTDVPGDRASSPVRPALPPFPSSLVSAAERLRLTSCPVPAHVADFRDALTAYCCQLRAAGVPREQIAAAIWPAFVGVVPTHLVAAAMAGCAEAYDRE